MFTLSRRGQATANPWRCCSGTCTSATPRSEARRRTRRRCSTTRSRGGSRGHSSRPTLRCCATAQGWSARWPRSAARKAERSASRMRSTGCRRCFAGGSHSRSGPCSWTGMLIPAQRERMVQYVSAAAHLDRLGTMLLQVERSGSAATTARILAPREEYCSFGSGWRFRQNSHQ